MQKKLKAMKKLYNECKKNSKTSNIILPPINPKPCLWWRGKKIIESEVVKKLGVIAIC